MAITRQKKEQVLKELKDLFSNSVATIVTDYKGMDVNSLSELRGKIRETGGTYLVAKKTLIQKALEDSNIEGLDVLGAEGQVAIAFAEKDAVATAKAIHEAHKANERPVILSGLMDGNILSASEVSHLATLPSREELLTKMVGSINAPVSGFVNVLAGNIRGLVTVLNGVKDQKS